jgi:epoxide hydrolase 4
MEAAQPRRLSSSDSRDAYADVNNVRVHYVEQGQGPLILFLHGFPEFWYSWNKFLPEFAADHHAVALDMRGYNLSSMPQAVEAYLAPVLVEDIRGLAEKLGSAKFTLVGHDWGGVVAWNFAYAHPDMLDKLVILNAPHPIIFARELRSNPEQQRASAYFNLFCTPAAEGVLGQNDFALPQQVVFAGNWATETDRQNYLDCWRRGLTGGLNYYRAAALSSVLSGEAPRAHQFTMPKTKLTVPTLVIWGEKDIALLTGNLEGLDQYVETLQVHRIPQAGHFVQHEQPAEVIASMRRFLDAAG